MERFEFYKPQGNTVPEVITVADLIPFGRENAIKRKYLLTKCKDHNIARDDREMRRAIERAKIDYVIISRSDGGGYYRPTKDDLADLQKYLVREKRKAIGIFKSIQRARKLAEDYKRGVL